jgi:hypothetical protein
MEVANVINVLSNSKAERTLNSECILADEGEIRYPNERARTSASDLICLSAQVGLPAVKTRPEWTAGAYHAAEIRHGRAMSKDKINQPESKKSVEESRIDATIKHDYGTEKRSIHVCGHRENVTRTFLREDGSIDIHLTLAQAVLDTTTPTDKHIELRFMAELLLRSRGEQTLSDFYDRFDSSDFGSDLGMQYTLLSAFWLSSIAKKYGAVSPEAIAARFIACSTETMRLVDEMKIESDTVLSLCDAWHLWQSECSGEHAAAYKSLKNQSNLQKAGPARTDLKLQRWQVVQEEASALWAAKPNYRSSASATASSIQAAVNQKLADLRLRGYSPATLVKVVGKLIKIDKSTSA